MSKDASNREARLPIQNREVYTKLVAKIPRPSFVIPTTYSDVYQKVSLGIVLLSHHEDSPLV